MKKNNLILILLIIGAVFSILIISGEVQKQSPQKEMISPAVEITQNQIENINPSETKVESESKPLQEDSTKQIKIPEEKTNEVQKTPTSKENVDEILESSNNKVVYLELKESDEIKEKNETKTTKEISNKTQLKVEENKTISNKTENINNSKTQFNETKKENNSIQTKNQEIKTTNSKRNKNTKNITQENKTTPKLTKNETNQTKTKKINLALYNDNQKEVEGKIPKDFDAEIIKKENKQTENDETFQKEVTIKSKKHLESELTIYSDIPKIAIGNENQIEIYWKNEGKKVKIKEFIDEDDDGFYERISWIVPHLSEQIYEIKINFNKEAVNSTEMNLEVISQTSQNPINFEVKLNYTNSENTNCNLKINDSTNQINNITQITQNKNISLNLPNGQYYWEVNCNDENQSKKQSGNFNINEEAINFQDIKNAYILGKEINFETPSEYTSTQIKITSQALSSPINLNYSSNEIKINSTTFSQIGIYELELTLTGPNKPTRIEKKNITLIKAELSMNKNESKVGENINFTISISSPTPNIFLYELKFGDGSTGNFDHYTPTINSIQKIVKYNYTQTGNFIPELVTTVGQDTYTITKNPIKVTSKEDTTPPKIDLLAPEDNEIINQTSVDFAFKINDNVKVSNCTFVLFNQTKYSTWNTDYELIKTDITNDQLIEVKLTNFQEGKYYWEIDCFDNSSNENYENRYFEIKLNLTTSAPKNKTSYEQESEIQNLTLVLKDFLEKQKTLSLEEKNALDILGISSDLTYFQKRLIQIGQDLGNNINFISDKDLREERKQESIKELEGIKTKIPTNFTLIKSNEYIKNNVFQSLENIIKNYLNNDKLKDRRIKELTKKVKELQSKITVTNKIKELSIDYLNESKKITLITQKIELKDNETKIILISIPEELNTKEIKFITKNKKINSNLYEINIDDLNEEKEINFYYEESIDLETIKKIDTVLFKEFASEGFGITGYFALDGYDGTKSIIYSVAIMLMILTAYLTFFMIRKIKQYSWKKEENVVRTLDYIEKCKIALKKEDVESAKEKYHKIKEIYPLIPEGFKKSIYSEIKKISVGLDKREINRLVKEYEETKKNKRKTDSKMIYEKIKKTYKKLPKKYQEKVYQRIFKNKEENIFA